MPVVGNTILLAMAAAGGYYVYNYFYPPVQAPVPAFDTVKYYEQNHPTITQLNVLGSYQTGQSVQRSPTEISEYEKLRQKNNPDPSIPVLPVVTPAIITPESLAWTKTIATTPLPAITYPVYSTPNPFSLPADFRITF